MRKMLAPLAAAVAAVLASGTVVAQTVKWNMATPYADREVLTKNTLQFAADLRQASNGAFDITVHTGGSLIKITEIAGAVQKAQVPIGEVFKASNWIGEPMFELDAIPFFAAGYKEARALLEASRKPIEDRLMARGMRALYLAPWPSQAFFTKRPVNSIADLKGSKMRTYNAQTARLAQLMGAIPTTVQATEIPQAFTSGIIDSMFTAAGTGVTTKAWDYTKFVYDTQAWVPCNIAFVNEKAFQALPEGHKKLLLAQAKVAEDRGWKMSEEENNLAPKQLAANGMTLAPISPTFAAELKKIGDTMLDDWLKKAGPDGKKVIDAYQASLKK
jgi:TRAP-type C4-dicarboxylate transport system substrate-binding protein